MTATHNHDNPQLITCATKIRKRRQFVASYQNIPQLLFGCHLDITFAQHYPASAVLQLKEINVLVTYFCYFQQYPVLLFSFSIPFFRLTFLSHFDFLSCEKNTYIWSTKKLCWKRNQSIVYSCFSRLAMINGQNILTCRVLYCRIDFVSSWIRIRCTIGCIIILFTIKDCFGPCKYVSLHIM